jgi:hypothetical protein
MLCERGLSLGSEPLYYRIVVNFCSTPLLQEFRSFIVRLGEVAIQVSYAYMSVADEAYTKCLLVARDSPHPLGTIAIGKVIGVGVGASEFREGDRVIAFTLTGGGAQSILSTHVNNAVTFNAREYNYLEALAVACLSIHRELLEVVKGANVLIVGKDLSIIPFAYAAQQYSCRVFTVPKHTLWPDVIKGEHISIYEGEQLFNVIVIASCNPLVISMVLRLAKDNATVIVHPALRSLVRLSDIGMGNVMIKLMQFGDMSSGEAVYTKFRDVIMSRIPVLKPQDFVSKPVFPAFVDLQST